jgi:hypothetical protein
MVPSDMNFKVILYRTDTLYGAFNNEFQGNSFRTDTLYGAFRYEFQGNSL